MKLKELLDQYGEWEWVSTQVPENGEADVAMIQIKKPKPKTVWDLEGGDGFYCLCSNGTILYYRYASYNDCEIENGNAFLTKEEAEKDVERRKVETLLLKHGGRRWFKKDEWNYYLSFGTDLKILVVHCTRVDYRQGAIYFDSEKQAKEAINAIGSERIRKALFEVR